jgi:serine protease Do
MAGEGWAQPSRPANAQGVAQLAAASGSYLGIWLWDRAGAIEVSRVQPASPAEASGVRVGDVMAEFDGKKITGTDQFSFLVRETPAGRTVKLKVLRDGAVQVLSAKIGEISAAERPGPMSARDMAPRGDVPRSLTTWRNQLLGIEAEPLSGQLAVYFGVAQGVLVRAVSGGSLADKAGIRAGDVITRFAKTPVSTPTEISVRLRTITHPVVPILVMRERKELNLTLTIE